MKPFSVSFGLLIFILFTSWSCRFEEKERIYKIGISQCTTDEAWRKAMNLDMRVEASAHPELSLHFADARESSEKQIEQIRTFIREKVDLLIISPNESTPVTPVAEEAYRAGKLCLPCVPVRGRRVCDQLRGG